MAPICDADSCQQKFSNFRIANGDIYHARIFAWAIDTVPLWILLANSGGADELRKGDF
jgi:hypothetical protein